ncbi:serine hydrolase domain-containing protein [Actinokineospora sp. 24-640]
MGIRKLAALGAAVVLGLTGTAGAAVAAPEGAGAIDRAVVQAALDRMAADGAQGVQVRVVDGGRTLLLRSGTARLGSARPVPLDGRFRVGSVTKTFTATVVLQLVAEGRVALDEPVASYLPGLLPDGDRVTVRMLLQHTSGLYDYTSAIGLDPENFPKIRFREFAPRELVAVATARPLEFEPGARHSYSNTNYVVAGLLIEKVTGQSYDRAVERRVLRPLGMRETRMGGRTPHGPHAHGYMSIGDRPVDVTAMNSSMAWAAGAMISTTADLDRFYAALLSGRVLAPAQLAEMTTTVEGYGLGLHETPLPCGGSVWGHNGGIPGYATFVMSTEDATTRVEMSVTTAPDNEAGLDGLNDALIEVFCP